MITLVQFLIVVGVLGPAIYLLYRLLTDEHQPPMPPYGGLGV